MRRRKKRRGAQKKRALHFLRTNYLVILLAALILAGIAVGSLLARQAAVTGNSGFGALLNASFSADTAKKGFTTLVFSSFFSSSVLLLLAFLCGLCAAGAPGFFLIPLFKGAGLGFSMGYLYIQYSLHGLAISALCILPEGLLTSFALILACREGFYYSLKLACIVLPTGRQFSLWDDFLTYCSRFLVCFGLALLGAVLEALLITGASSYLF